MTLTRPYRVILDAVVDEFYKNPPKNHEGVSSVEFLKRIPNKRRNKKILKNSTLIIKYLEHYGYFENCSYYAEVDKVCVIPSCKALFYKNVYRKQIKDFVFKDIFVPLLSAFIGALITLFLSA